MSEVGASAAAALEPVTVTGLIGALAARAPQAPAILHGERTLTFGELDQAARRVAGGLAGMGVGPGDRVALWLPNVPAWFALFLACARLGAIAVAVNTRFRSAEVEDIIGRSGAKVLALWPGFKDIDFVGILDDVDPHALESLETVIVYDREGDGGAAGGSILGRRVVGYGEMEACAPRDQDRSERDLGCGIFTTSGTTKAPKFVLHSQAGIVDHARQVAADFGFDAPDAVVLQALPLCGVFGLSQAMASLAAGRPMVLMPSFDAQATARLVRAHRVTHMNGTDDMFHHMLAARDEAMPFPTLRLCGYALFNPGRKTIVADAEARGLRLVGLYGMSEVQALYARQRVEAAAERRSLAGGFPVAPEAAVRVRDPDTGRLLPHGEAGELELRGPSRMLGYFGDRDATAEALTEDGFVRSGDLGHTLGDGSFVFLSRMGDVLRLGGFLVSPAEIEAYVQEHPSVAGCQVVGVAGPEGPRAVAFVTAHRGAVPDEAELKAYCAGGMARYKVPVRFVTLAEFPTVKSANGSKIQRARLRDMASSEIAARAGGG